MSEFFDLDMVAGAELIRMARRKARLLGVDWATADVAADNTVVWLCGYLTRAPWKFRHTRRAVVDEWHDAPRSTLAGIVGSQCDPDEFDSLRPEDKGAMTNAVLESVMRGRTPGKDMAVYAGTAKNAYTPPRQVRVMWALYGLVRWKAGKETNSLNRPRRGLATEPDDPRTERTGGHADPKSSQAIHRVDLELSLEALRRTIPLEDEDLRVLERFTGEAGTSGSHQRGANECTRFLQLRSRILAKIGTTGGLECGDHETPEGFVSRQTPFQWLVLTQRWSGSTWATLIGWAVANWGHWRSMSWRQRAEKFPPKEGRVPTGDALSQRYDAVTEDIQYMKEQRQQPPSVPPQTLADLPDFLRSAGIEEGQVARLFWRHANAGPLEHVLQAWPTEDSPSPTNTTMARSRLNDARRAVRECCRALQIRDVAALVSELNGACPMGIRCPDCTLVDGSPA